MWIQIPKSHIFLHFIYFVLVLSYHSISADDTLATNQKIVAGAPIIIQAEARTYDQPTLSEYQKCHENLDQCLHVCETTNNISACKSECPTCPILIDHNYVVQGINDTDYKLPMESSINTTNVVRLTNEIHNIIHHNLGNITSNNVNNIEVQQQNVSTTGGKFGLGYNTNGSCCYVMRDTRNCPHCPQKRHRVCGTKCKSRVMHAKLSEKCVNSVCKQHLTYVPFHKRKQRHNANACNYTPNWPYVYCQSQQSTDPQTCQHCMQLPYGYILRNGVPGKCIKCFNNQRSNFNSPIWYGPPASYYGYPSVYPPPVPQLPPIIYDEDIDLEHEFIPKGNDWKLEKTKCRDAEGKIIENCEATIENVDMENGNNAGNIADDEEDDFDVSPIDDSTTGESTENSLGLLPEAQDEVDDEYDDNDLTGSYSDNRRHRRHRRNRRTYFQRSAYSRRLRNKDYK